MEPEYLICLECESPVYVFEWVDDRLKDVVCPVCGNSDPSAFTTEEGYEALAADERFSE